MPRRKRTENRNRSAPSVEVHDESLSQYCRRVLDDPKVRGQIHAQAQEGSLPSSVLMRMWDQVEGKPSTAAQKGNDATMFTDEELDFQIKVLVKKHQEAEG